MYEMAANNKYCSPRLHIFAQFARAMLPCGLLEAFDKQLSFCVRLNVISADVVDRHFSLSLLFLLTQK